MSETSSHPPIPAGWYPHPTMVNTVRYWDGSKWTDQIAPDSTCEPTLTGPPASATQESADGELVRRIKDAKRWTWIVPFVGMMKARKIKQVAPSVGQSVFKRATILQVIYTVVLILLLLVGGKVLIASDYPSAEIERDLIRKNNSGTQETTRLTGSTFPLMKSADCEAIRDIEIGATSDCKVQFDDGTRFSWRVEIVDTAGSIEDYQIP